MKFGRTYDMVVQGESRRWTFGSPFTLRFTTQANGTPTMNTAEFFVYNLPENVRNDLLMDIYQDPTLRTISFAAGYIREPTLPVVFVGNVFWAYSYRQGPDWITQIHCVDGGGALDVADIGTSLIGGQSGTTLGQIYRTLVQALPGLSIGLISKTFDEVRDPRGVVLSGNPWEELVRRIIPVNAQLFVNKGKVYIILQDEYVPNPGGITDITPDTGMVGSPRRQGAMTIATMIFEPRLEIGQKVTLHSSAPYAGEKKLLSIRHYGEISEAECGNLLTEATFLRPDNPVELSAVAGEAA
jgi:hypothetical protein